MVMDSDSLLTEDSELQDQSCNWPYLPDSILLYIFRHFTAYQLVTVGKTCKSWYRVASDEFLWRDLLYKDFKVDRSVSILPGKSSWRLEYKRLSYHTPVVQTEILHEHSHQVLHVSFAHNGKMFATCSKDGFVVVWNSGYPARIQYKHDMKSFSWKYTQFSQFNQSDTLLLVSGVHFGAPHSTSGEIAVFSLKNGFELQCRVVNKPYDIFGTWYNERYLLSGDLHWLAHLVSASILWLNKASQETASEHTAIMNQLYKFYNRNASSIRAIMVATCLVPDTDNLESEQGVQTNRMDGGSNGNVRNPNEKGNPVSHRDLNSTSDMQQTVQDLRPEEPPQELGYASSRVRYATLEGAFQNWRRLDSDQIFASPIQYSDEYRKAEANAEEGDGRESTVSPDESSDSDDGRSTPSEASMETEDGSEGEEVLDQKDKLLIFTTGSKTYTPHQIGFKRIRPLRFPRRLDPGPSLRERIAERQREKERERMADPNARPDPDWLDYDSVAHRFDQVDHLIDLHGHIIGMGLSPDHRYLYVNSRPWPRGYVIRNPLDPPPIAQEIDIHVIDLVTLQEVGTMLRAHKAYTPNDECFFIFLDVCNEFVASGAEDQHGYLWDRHYGVCLTKFPHDDVVNSVAFNPKDSEMLVTTSDDYSIKIWRSRNRVAKLGI